MHADPTLQAVLPTLARAAQHGPWARAVALRYLQGPPPDAPAGSPPQPLWPGGGQQTGGRFTPLAGFGSFDTVYLATDPMTALAEVEAVFETGDGAFVYRNHQPYGVFCVEGVVVEVLDLTDPAVQAALGTNDQELRGPWVRAQERAKKGGPLPPTQRLGQAAHGIPDIGGLRYPSARINGDALAGVNLVVFADRLARNPANRLEVVTTGGLFTQRLP